MTTTQISGARPSAGPRPIRSASAPTTIGPAARPSRLLAIDSVAKAVARIDDGVRLATIAPAGPVIAAQKNAPRQSTPT